MGSELTQRLEESLEMKRIKRKTMSPTNSAMLGGAAAGVLMALPAMAGSDNISANTNKVEHVLLISVDGMHR